ncbi:hypothetical protein PSACC_00502 [Paramicrosporidium saccamoebae]|uniref:Uncharacterized protein n=1 Tax=Paramicrosporidium saccamoebae TaxID=1246581 RepID=A0A2H9TPN1_9FUNG|nr:hypothetical protein PSACC_00502 [Paramicrosporidium saccamoebae]
MGEGMDLVDLNSMLELEPISNEENKTTENRNVTRPQMRIMDLGMSEAVFSGTYASSIYHSLECSPLEDINMMSGLLVSSPPMKKSSDIKLPSPYQCRDSRPIKHDNPIPIDETEKTELPTVRKNKIDI